MAKAPRSENGRCSVSDAKLSRNTQLVMVMVAEPATAPPIGAEHCAKKQLLRISSGPSEQLMAPPPLWAEFFSKMVSVIVTALSFMRTAPALNSVAELSRKVEC